MAKSKSRKLNSRIEMALLLAHLYAGVDGESHKQWVIDSMVRALTGCPIDEDSKGIEFVADSKRYLEFIEDYCAGEDGPNTFMWDEGVAP